MRIVNPGYLARGREEVLLDEHVMLGEEDTKPRVRVIPANDALVGIAFIFSAIDFLPGILRKRDVSAGLRCVQCLDRSANVDDAVGIFADQDTADLGLRVRLRVLSYATRYF